MASPDQIGIRQSRQIDHCYSKVADPVVVPSHHEEEDGGINGNNGEGVDFARHEQAAPVITETASSSSLLQLERPVEGIKISESAALLIAECTRSKTKVKYASVENKWSAYCSKYHYPLLATTNTYLNFLASEFDRELAYTYLKGYNSALAPYIKGVDKVLLRKMLRGMYNNRPPKPKYCVIWDVDLVLTYVGAMRSDTDMFRSQKTATLLMLLSGNRVNMLSHMKLLTCSSPTMNARSRLMRL